MYAVILTVPRVAALRPAAAPAIIKSLLTQRGLESRILDINLDFHTVQRNQWGESQWKIIDEYFFNPSVVLPNEVNALYQQWIDQWVRTILDLESQWLFVSVFTWQAQIFTRDFLKAWRSATHTPVVIGGQGLIREENGSFASCPSFAHELKKQGLIAHWIRGEIETTIDAFIAGKYDAPGIDSDIMAPVSDVNDHPMMDFDDFEIVKYQSGYASGVLPMETSRGCIRSCVFCDIPSMHGGYRYKKGDRLADEMIHYYEKYQVKDFFFHDALCNGSVKDFRVFNQRLIAYYQDHELPDRAFKYSSHYIVRDQNLMPEKDFELMGKAGGETMVIGVESGSDRIKVQMKKGFTNADLDYNMAMFSRYGINAYFAIVVGFPTETQQDFQDTLDMLTRYQRYVADGTIIGVNFGTTFTMEEGTPIWNDYKKFDIVGINNNRPRGPDWRCKSNPELTYKERINRRIQAQEHAVALGYTFWKGDDQLRILMDKYKERLARLAGVIHQ